MKTGAVIAAAGVPGGFSSYDTMENVDAADMIRRMIFSFRRAGVADIVVVTGDKAEETERKLKKLGVVFLRSPSYETEQLIDYAARGFSYLRHSCRRIFFCPAENPLFTEETIRLMLEQKAPVVIPSYEGKKGHPVLADSDLTDRIAAYRGDRGLKGAIDASGVQVVVLPVGDGGVIASARREKEFELIAEKQFPQDIHPRVKVQLVKNEAFFGPGMMVLLKQIEVLGNIREACEKTGMSYSKGWTLIRTAEKEMGCTIVERSPGGKHGGTARVTATGRRLMDKYEKLCREAEAYTEKRYRELFGREI